MEYNFCNVPENYDLIKELKGAFLKAVHFDDSVFHRAALKVVLETENKFYEITNSEPCLADGDDYPLLSFREKGVCELPVRYAVGERINDIMVIEDEISFSYNDNNWNVKCDIALVFQTDSSKFTFIAEDSLAGFILPYIQNKHGFVVGNMKALDSDLEKYWEFKTLSKKPDRHLKNL